MAIRFWATVSLSSSRKHAISGSVNYHPHLRFDLPGMTKMVFGLTRMDDADWPFQPGETKIAHFLMIGHPDMQGLAGELRPGTVFELVEGGRTIVGTGIVDEIDEAKIDVRE